MSLLPMNGQGSYQSAATRIARQRALAAQLRNQSMETPQGEMIGGGGGDSHFGARPGIYVAPDWTEQLAPLVAAGVGAWQDSQADAAEAADKKAQLEDYRRVLSGLPKTTGLRDVTVPGALTPTPDAPIAQQPTSMFGTSEAAPVMPKTALPGAMAQSTQGAPTTTQEPYQLSQDEYNAKLADFAGSISPDNPMTEAIRAKVLLKTLDAPEKVYEREDRQQAAKDAAELETIKQKALQAERLGDRAEAARLQREFLDRQYQQSKEFQVAQHNDLMAQREADRLARSADRRYGVDNRAPGEAYGTPIVTEQGIFRINKSTGQLEPVSYAGQSAPAQKPLTESQANSAGYLGRMKAAESELDKLPASANPSVLTATMGGLPLVGNAARSVVSTGNQQVQRQKQEDWVRAKLRKESGAAIAKEEMDREIQTYFPSPYDKPDTITAKKVSRAEAEKALQKSTGRAAPAGSISWGELK